MNQYSENIMLVGFVLTIVATFATVVFSVVLSVG